MATKAGTGKKKTGPNPVSTEGAWALFKARESAMDELSEVIVSGNSIADFSRSMGVAYNTVLNWINDDAGRVANYARAREARADLIFDALDDVSEQAVTAETAIEVAGLRLKADNIKWKLAKMAPKKYGERQQVDLNAAVEVSIEQVDAKIARLLAK